jgi:hypothetical protein
MIARNKRARGGFGVPNQSVINRMEGQSGSIAGQRSVAFSAHFSAR